MRFFKPKNKDLIQYEVQTLYNPETKERPPELDDNLIEEITAEEAIAVLTRNLPLENKRVTGDIILGRQDIENPFELNPENGKKIQMAGLPEFQNFARTPYPTKIILKKCIFEGKIILAGMELKQEVRFISTRFHSEVDFQFAIFNHAMTCHRCCFEDRFSLSDATFWDAATFNRTHFHGPADFYNASFQKGAGFTYAEFHAYCTFTTSKFNSTMLMTPCLDFSNTICHETVFFMDVRFDGIADFKGTQFRLKVDLTNAVFKYISIKQAQFGWLEINWEQIGHSKLLFGAVTVQSAYLLKSHISEDELNEHFLQRLDAPLTEKHRQYDILKGIFLKQGDFVSADQCFYDWKQIERKESPWGWNPETWIVKAFHYLNWLSCGYGVKPIRTLFFASMIILLFGAFYTLTDPAIARNIHFISLNKSVFHSFFGNLEYSFLVFMNFTNTTTQSGPIPLMLYLLERILGWFTLLLFVTTYTRIMLR